VELSYKGQIRETRFHYQLTATGPGEESNIISNDRTVPSRPSPIHFTRPM